ncbi:MULTISPECIES: type II secretion system F family protein [unclassified Campylobacter]|uniref:type II secretion system F family protein n=1 Tax=unclassified Campylobacter TaxID=2593542 RepID=UPI001237FC9F|nr:MULTISPECIES: type II secretion system F family protein [unclassified Campylobacter]KAA6225082.1 type II secretion system F family protein [Campylobacter sp. LR196d]KAA6226096.1 type II secretion system F family protein [Campylobacter sp. LR185c]KAA6228043.1 type II secretion system F family protein [Campylobacter sp. LR286c]KAA6231296.1 type II secretion system F family protein [Campylobacter sp. LR264d]KAA6231508.1 type II secretion system F family protein [Campylobacter sp. LR291e]
MNFYLVEFRQNDTQKSKIIYANDLSDVQNTVLKQGLIVINIKKIKILESKIENKHFILFFKELSLLSEVGLSINACLNELEKAFNQKHLNKAIKALKANLGAGQNLSLAFKEANFGLGLSELTLIKMAENTGELSKVFLQISKLRQGFYENQKKLKKTLHYPIIVLIVLCFAFVFLMLFVVPNFKDLFENMNATLPLITRFMLGSYEFLSVFYLPLIFILVILILSLNLAYKKHFSFALFCDFMLLKLPILSKLIIYNQHYYFFFTFSLLLKSGVSIKQAFELARSGVKNKALGLEIDLVYSNFSKGIALDEAFKKSIYFESMVISMLAVALKSAKLELLSLEIANYYALKQDDLMGIFLSLIEPLMTLFVAILVLLLALGIFLPMWDLSSGANL